MSKPDPRVRVIGRFTLLFAGWLTLFIVIYPFLLPTYERLVLTFVNPLSMTFDPPVEYRVAEQATLDMFVINPQGRALDLKRGYEPWAIFLSLPLFPALMLATPLAWKVRLKRLGLGMAALFAIHGLALIGLVRGTVCTQIAERAGDSAPVFCTWMIGLSLTSGQFGAFLVWAAATWAFWLTSWEGEEAAPTT